MNRHARQQSGFVAIFAVMIIMGILTLLTIGFSNITRQAQRRTLDDQLNTQAFYAAESGINMARAALAQKDDCDGGGFNYDIDTALNIGISCLLIDVTPADMDFGTVPVPGQDQPITAYMGSTNPPDIDKLIISWDSPDPAAPAPLPNATAPDLTPLNNWGNQVGILRLDVIPDTVLARGDLVNNSRTFYLYPTDDGSFTGGAAVNAGPDNLGRIILVTCNDPGAHRCKTTIQLSGGTSLSNGYHIRLQAYYNPVRVNLDAEDTTGDDVDFRDGQATVDSTGRANDVYRRIKVSMPINPDASWNIGDHPPFSILSGESICKRIVGVPGNSQVDTSGGVGSDQACLIN